MASAVAATPKVSNCEPMVNAATLLLVAVTVTALVMGSVLMPLRVIPAAALRSPASRAEKSTPSVAVTPVVSRVKVRLWPGRKPPPSRETA